MCPFASDVAFTPTVIGRPQTSIAKREVQLAEARAAINKQTETRNFSNPLDWSLRGGQFDTELPSWKTIMFFQGTAFRLSFLAAFALGERQIEWEVKQIKASRPLATLADSWCQRLTIMHYDWTAIPDADVPTAVDRTWQHVVTTYASETNKTASMWRAIPDDKLDFKPHDKVNSIRTILVHQLLSERRFFGQFVGTIEPPVEELLPDGEQPNVAAYIEKYIRLCQKRLPQFAQATTEWWLEPRPFFGGLVRERVWIFWRRILHTCHHRTQVQTWLRLAGVTPVPAIYGPSGDVTWNEADPTYSLAAAKRGG